MKFVQHALTKKNNALFFFIQSCSDFDAFFPRLRTLTYLLQAMIGYAIFPQVVQGCPISPHIVQSSKVGINSIYQKSIRERLTAKFFKGDWQSHHQYCWCILVLSEVYELLVPSKVIFETCR